MHRVSALFVGQLAYDVAREFLNDMEAVAERFLDEGDEALGNHYVAMISVCLLELGWAPCQQPGYGSFSK